ncbi:MAG: D-alanyl-D-alanine carboxypeptidase/D-alanyl-D-alanine-endopeptidase [Gemmatimonadota bacterium]|nr:D-alanyl-D-alanine carboxypeptidase/D-alanyl-D-alanine-endopeptidase [Gemmatimonadota bacterium]MDH5759597.1 D-alanyl-D-alanine carboxypeptidase/D-alanyl-D-alanine-endopeptidase [Gemmatimonadota bacterium]
MIRRVVFGALVVTQSACATLGGGGVDGGSIRKTVDTPPFDQVHWGILAVDARSGRVLFERNANRKFVPASNQKVLVTATALSLLGPEYRYRTDVWRTGRLDRETGTVEGDLVLSGSGDPTLIDSADDSIGISMGTLAERLWSLGVRRVTGSVVVDATAWDSTTVADTWEVADLPWTYAATGGAFAVDRGELRLVVTGGETPGDTATFTWSPVGTVDYVSGVLLTGPADSTARVRASYLPESRRLSFTGSVPAGTVDTLGFAVRDPVRQAAAVVVRRLEERGIQVEGGWRVEWEKGQPVGESCRVGALALCPGAGVLAVLESPPLSAIVAGILKPSQNWMTEQLIHTLGWELGDGGSWGEGIAVIREFLLREVGVDSLDILSRDGSGLSAYNLVTPRAMVRILRYMDAGPHGEVYRSALAEPGRDGSTLRRRLTGLEGSVFAKTGTISNVNSLSGYLVRPDRREIIFSILTNGSGLPASEVRVAIDQVVEALAR